jgi:hypothetical protein
MHYLFKKTLYGSLKYFGKHTCDYRIKYVDAKQAKLIHK